jgi:PAS domain S-box-containing protein
MIDRFLWILGVLSLGLPMLACAQPKTPIIWNEASQQIAWLASAEVCLDASGDYTWAQMRDSSAKIKFKPFDYQLLNNQTKVYWLRFTLQNKLTKLGKVIFSFDELDKVDVFQVSDNQMLSHQTGALAKNIQPPFKLEGYSWLSLELQPKQTTIFYVRIENQTAYTQYFIHNFFPRLMLYSPQGLEQTVSYMRGWYYGLMGATILVILYCFILFGLLRSQTNGYLAIMATILWLYGSLASGAALDNLGWQYVRFFRGLYYVVIAVFLMFLILFARRFLGLARRLPLWERRLGVLLLILIFYPILVLSEYWLVAYNLLIYLSLLVVLSIFWAGLVVYWQGYLPARVFVGAMLFFVGLIFMNVFVEFQFVEQLLSKELYNYSVGLFFLLLLALSLADRVNLIRSQLAKNPNTSQPLDNQAIIESKRSDILLDEQAQIKQPTQDLLKKVEEITLTNLQLEQQLSTQTQQLQASHYKLKEIEQRFQYVIEATNDVLIDWNAQSGDTYFSNQNYTMLGFEPFEFEPTHENWERLRHPEDKYKIVEAFKNLFMQDTDHYEIEYRMQSKSGEYVWVLERAKVIERGINQIPIRIVGSRVNIDPLKASETKLRQAYQEYQNIQDALNESVLVAILDGRGGIKQVNQLFCQLSNYAESELLFRHSRRFISDFHNPIYFKYIWRTVQGGHIWRGDIRCKARGGGSYWIEIVINPITDEADNIQEYLVIGQEITARKNISEERRKLLDDLTRYNKDLEQFAYITSHNLRAPIASILGLVSIFDKANCGTPTNGEVIKRLEVSAKDMDETFRDINQILATRERVDEVKEKIALPELMQNMRINFEQQIRNSHARINENFAEISTIYSIKNYIESIFINLLSNAIKYRSPKRDLVINIQTKTLERFILITVQDNGLGIDLKKNGDKVFGLYKRFHFHTGGKGLGLHLVKTQIEALGGRIEVQSEEDKGTTFLIYLNKEG